MLYGKMQRVRLRSVTAVALFLKGVPVLALWRGDAPGREHLVVPAIDSGDRDRTVVLEPEWKPAPERWGIEPLLHNAKRWWGMMKLWKGQIGGGMGSCGGLQVRSTAYALVQLLALKSVGLLPVDGDCTLALGSVDHDLSSGPVDVTSNSSDFACAMPASRSNVNLRRPSPSSTSVCSVEEPGTALPTCSRFAFLTFVVPREHGQNSGRQATARVSSSVNTRSRPNYPAPRSAPFRHYHQSH